MTGADRLPVTVASATIRSAGAPDPAVSLAKVTALPPLSVSAGVRPAAFPRPAVQTPRVQFMPGQDGPVQMPSERKRRTIMKPTLVAPPCAAFCTNWVTSRRFTAPASPVLTVMWPRKLLPGWKPDIRAKLLRMAVMLPLGTVSPQGAPAHVMLLLVQFMLLHGLRPITCSTLAALAAVATVSSSSTALALAAGLVLPVRSNWSMPTDVVSCTDVLLVPTVRTLGVLTPALAPAFTVAVVLLTFVIVCAFTGTVMRMTPNGGSVLVRLLPPDREVKRDTSPR